jgi:Domain of unknown function (DUF4390)
MSSVVAARQPTGLRARRGLRGMVALVIPLVLAWLLVLAPAARAQGVEVLALAATRGTDTVALDYQLRVTLPRAVEEAAQRGVPLYFTASATLWKPRWYWRDDRVARVRREWRLTYQPLTSTWRVSQGGLGQSHATLADAMAAMTRATAWRVADAAVVEADARPYVEFSWELDTSQLPRPLQIGLTGVGGSSDWNLGLERSVRVEPRPEPRPDAARPEARPDTRPEAR